MKVNDSDSSVTVMVVVVEKKKFRCGLLINITGHDGGVVHWREPIHAWPHVLVRGLYRDLR